MIGHIHTSDEPRRSRVDLNQGFQLLGIAWREKHQARSARTHEWGPGRNIFFP